ncbi:DUF3019 domain-containing protein [Pseudoalteromonas mariniglutinosa]|uniref:DUF3019 domain-containing protein n=1 Tax=Pseudoalteromonas mariniglutinosa TaxID=206042 RepID=UPI00384EA384
MFFRWMVIFLMPTFVFAENMASSAALVALPDTCVALREGRNCYANIEITWQQQTTGNYCLRDASSKHIMQCWLMQQKGTFRYEFNATDSVYFELINSNSGKILATTQVQLQWVYKNRQKKRRWRLF